MACQFNSGEMAPLDGLDEYIQDALDLIEFANGPAGSRWGGLRARMGHPAPFNLKMLGIGNEQWGARYIDRYRRFAAVLKAKHLEIQLISSAGPFARGEQFEFLWERLREMKADFVDEHYYSRRPGSSRTPCGTTPTTARGRRSSPASTRRTCGAPRARGTGTTGRPRWPKPPS